MPSDRRASLLIALLAAGASAALGYAGLWGFAWNDYDDEARPAVEALVAGDLRGFLVAAPLYGGSLLLRAPFALLPSAWGGGDLAVYRALAVPCLAAAALLAAYVAIRMRRRGAAPVAWGAALALLAANPISYRALEIGHPEELLVAVLCVFAVLAARADRPLAAGALVGVAAAAKPWALLAVPVVLVVADRRRLAALAVCALAALAVAAPFLAVAGEQLADRTRGAAQTSVVFQPWQAWWFLGEHGRVVRGADGLPKDGYRAAPAWLSGVTRPVVLVSAPALALLWWWRRRAGRADPRDGLLLLALVLLVRCLLDPWNTVYYVVPTLFALTAWEGLEARRAPVLALLVTVAAWLTWEELPRVLAPDGQSLAFLAWAVPLAAGLALRLYAPARFEALRAALPRRRAAGLERGPAAAAHPSSGR